MRTKKYWENLSEQHYRDLQEARNINDLKDQAIKFLLESPETYRVKLTADKNAMDVPPYFKDITKFEYVDGKGKYHRHFRPVHISDLEVISTNADTAVLKFETTKGHYTFWILNKADETIAEIPEDYICLNKNKVCKAKGEIKDAQIDS